MANGVGQSFSILYGAGKDENFAYVLETLKLFDQLQLYRNVFANQWEEVSQLIAPEYRNTFFYGNYNWPGQKKTDRQIDATGMLALARFGAILDSLLTPRNMKWARFTARDPELMRSRRVQLYFDRCTDIVFREKYEPTSGFIGQNPANWRSLGAFGNASMFIDRLASHTRQRGIRYKAVPLGEVFYTQNHQGIVDGFIRWFRMTARQAYQKWGDTIPEVLHPALENLSEQPYNFLHRVHPRDDYDPERLDDRGKPWKSCYISIEGKAVLEEGGYQTFPMPTSRYDQFPGETYGRGPAMAVLPALKTLNAEKATFLKQGHRAADPILLTTEDGLVDGANLTPGAINPGGMSADGKPLVGVLPAGAIQVTQEMMAEEKGLINDAFLVSLFQILTETPQMSATEVIERTNEKGILLAPTVGRQCDEYLGPMLERDFDLCNQMGLLPPMPPELVEAGADYSVTYTSPLARAMHAQEIAGFNRSLEVALSVVNATGDASHLDPFDFGAAIPEIAHYQGVPARWMADPGAIAQKQKARAQAMQRQQAIQAAPAQAAMVKAAAVAAKAGVAPGQQPGTSAPAPAAPAGPIIPGLPGPTGP